MKFKLLILSSLLASAHPVLAESCCQKAATKSCCESETCECDPCECSPCTKKDCKKNKNVSTVAVKDEPACSGDNCSCERPKTS